MNTSKALVLASIVAMAVMAFVGPKDAIATELYSGATTVKAGTLIWSSVEGSATLTDTSANPIVTCTRSSVNGTVGNAGASSATVATSGEIWFEECVQSVTTVELGSLDLHHVAGGKNGTLTAKGFDIVAHVFGVECGYTAGTGTDLGTLTGSTTGNATMDVNAILSRKTGGFLCPSTARWIANYAITSPTPLHVTAS